MRRGCCRAYVMMQVIDGSLSVALLPLEAFPRLTLTLSAPEGGEGKQRPINV